MGFYTSQVVQNTQTPSPPFFLNQIPSGQIFYKTYFTDLDFPEMKGWIPFFLPTKLRVPKKKHPPGWLDEIWPSNINSSTIPITSTRIKRLGQDQHSRRISPPKPPQLPRHPVPPPKLRWTVLWQDVYDVNYYDTVSIPGKKNNNPGVEKQILQS